MHDLEKIYIAGQIHLAEIVIAVLADHGILAHLIDKRDSSYLFGDVEVYVKPEDVAEARKIITENAL